MSLTLLTHLPYILLHGLTQTFFIPPPPLTASTLPSLHTRVFLITGGYTGIGLHVASILYSLHGTVWIAGRSESKAATAIEQIQSRYPDSSGKLLFLKLDLSDLSSIKPAVQEFLRRNEREGRGRLHWLDNNAGVMVPPRGARGARGEDLQAVTNVYGPFLLTKLLLPILRETARVENAALGVAKGDDAAEKVPAPVRVSWAGSAATFLSQPRNGVAWTKDGKDLLGAFSDPQGLYALTKACNWYLAVEFGRRFGEADGVLHNSYNPGNLSTELQRTTEEHIGSFAKKMISFLLHPAEFGAYTELYAGLSEDISLSNPGDQGGWIVPWGRKDVMRGDMLAESKRTDDDAVGTRLWEWCEGIVREYE